ncbi:MAG: protein kinase, partial [Oscillospiraceae bacterium]|nr:protein kinase [Oscillospiraceae bacterium]
MDTNKRIATGDPRAAAAAAAAAGGAPRPAGGGRGPAVVLGETIQGRKAAYRLERPQSKSPEADSYVCTHPTGTYLMKVYKAGPMLDSRTRQAYLSLPRSGNLLPAVDVGTLGPYSFDILPFVPGGDLSGKLLPSASLAKVLVPQLNEALHLLHEKGLVHRDVKPENILSLQGGAQVALCDFGSLGRLEGAAFTMDRTAGLTPGYAAPETASLFGPPADYYALGITVLTLMKGKWPFEGMTEQEISLRTADGILPGLEKQKVEEGRCDPANMADRLQQLVWGLTRVDPAQRWGYQQVKDWCQGREIPTAVFTGGAGAGTFARPYTVKGVLCRDKKSLALALAADWENTKVALTQGVLGGFFAGQEPELATRLYALTAAKAPAPWHPEASAADALVFKALYTIDPALPGLWWKGVQYPSASALSAAALLPGQEGLCHSLSALLQNGGLSHFMDARAAAGKPNPAAKAEFAGYEAMERKEKDAGLYRYLYRTLPKDQPRAFAWKGWRVESREQMGRFVQGRGKALEEEAGALLQDPMFAAWLWCHGFESAHRQILARLPGGDKEARLQLFLMLAEKVCTDPTPVRALALTVGAISPVWWLRRNIGLYTYTNQAARAARQRLEGTPLGPNMPVEEILRTGAALQDAYQNFARLTCSDPFQVRGGHPDPNRPILPNVAQACFTTHESRDVTLGWLQENKLLQQGQVGAFLDTSAQKESARLQRLKNDARQQQARVSLPASRQDYTAQGGRQIAAMVFQSIVSFGFGAACLLAEYRFGLVALLLGASLLFPMWASQACHRKSVLSRLSYSGQEEMDRYCTRLEERENELPRLKTAWVGELMSGRALRLEPQPLEKPQAGGAA